LRSLELLTNNDGLSPLPVHVPHRRPRFCISYANVSRIVVEPFGILCVNTARRLC
jgi:hypothetical protein